MRGLRMLFSVTCISSLMNSLRAKRPDGQTVRSWICPACEVRRAKHHRAPSSAKHSSARIPSRRRPVAFELRSRGIGPFWSQSSDFSRASIVAAPPTRKARLPDAPARTRFAPSPTGYLHIGGLRTALFSYLLARRTGGQFLLRIEDTDQKRLVPDAESKLCETLQWAGLEWDEGPQVGGPCGPYRQSERNAIYQQHARRLLEGGSAYRCFCTQQSAGSAHAAYVTSGCYQDCSSLSPKASQERAEGDGEAFTIRLHLPKDVKDRTYPDLIYGNIQRLKRSPSMPQIASEDDTGGDASDTVLIKSDGTPTYHFANVVDDHLMRITHVIRGSEWMASTPLHYDIYAAFGWSPPKFAHVGLLVDQNKAKLSKRNQDLALDVSSMRDVHGVLPYALNNFLALLGWSNPTDNDVMDMEALTQKFDLKFTRGNAMVRTEKLWYLQKQHVALRCHLAEASKSFDPIRDVVLQIVQRVREVFSNPLVNADIFSEAYFGNEHEQPDVLAAYCTEILLTDRKSYQNAKQFVERNRYFFEIHSNAASSTQARYNKAGTITTGMIEDTSALIFRDIQSPARDATRGTHESFEDKFHNVVRERVWDALFSPQNANVPFCDPPERVPTIALDDLDEDFRQGCQPSDEDVQRLGPQLLELRGRYQTYHAALMRYFRFRLSDGLPGPSMSAVVTILGVKECRKRLGLDITPQLIKSDKADDVVVGLHQLAKGAG